MVKQVVVYDTETGEISQAIVDAFKAANPTAVSTDEDNTAVLGSDDLIFVPAPTVADVTGLQGALDAKAPLATTLTTVDAGTDLSTARPVGAGVVYWLFGAGVDVGTDGANVVNGLPGDLYYVAGV